MNFISDLDKPLLKLSPKDVFTLRDACNGVHIFGAIGSGKTSGSGQALAAAYLRAGMGGLVLCAKPEEVELWQRYAKQNGRSNSVLMFDEKQGFNFITYELARHGMQGISNVIECLMRVIETADHAAGATGGTGDVFWTKSIRQLLAHAIPVLYAAYGNVTVGSIVDFVTTAATKIEQFTKDEAWLKTSYAAETLRKLVQNPAIAMDAHAMTAMESYWFNQYPAIPDKTRGNVLISLTTCLDRFKHGRLRQAFCANTTLVPEMTFHGTIIIMAMPVLTWNEDGIIGQQLFKFMWQRAVESRNGLDAPQRARPVFLWADEAQYFVNLKDDEFLSTCRGSKACIVFLTQTLPTYYARLGKDKSDAADGLVGKFNTQIFHQNACNRTNHFAAELIGRTLQLRNTTGTSYGKNTSHGMNGAASIGEGSSNGGANSFGGITPTGWSLNRGNSSSSNESWGTNVSRGSNENTSYGTTEQMDYLVQPRVFANDLKSGGPKNKKKVTAIWVKAGAQFAAAQGGNTLLTMFEQ